MSISRVTAAVAMCSALFAFLGGTAGYMIGRLVPGYYRGVFHGGDSPTFDPIQVGIGQGVTQGLVGGAVIGILLVGIVAWHDTRSSRRAYTD